MASPSVKEKKPKQPKPVGVPLQFRPAQKAQKAKLHLDRRDDLQLAPTSALPGAFKVVISLPHQCIEMTIHHPVGETTLSKDEWVATPTGDIPYLLARAENPEKKKYADEVQKIYTEAGLAKGLLITDGKTVFPATGLSVNQMREAVKPENKELGSAVRALYKTYIAELETLRKNAMSNVKAPGTYETMGGPLADIPQKPIGCRGRPAEFVADRIVTRLSGGFSEDNPLALDLSKYKPSKPNLINAGKVVGVSGLPAAPPSVAPVSVTVATPTLPSSHKEEKKGLVVQFRAMYYEARTNRLYAHVVFDDVENNTVYGICEDVTRNVRNLTQIEFSRLEDIPVYETLSEDLLDPGTETPPEVQFVLERPLALHKGQGGAEALAPAVATGV